MSTYRAGLDLGQVSDYSALVIAQRAPIDGNGVPLPTAKPAYWVRHIQRWKGTSYPALVGHVAAILSHPELVDGGVTLTIDATGVGRPVLDIFRAARAQGELPCRPLAITITAGEKLNEDETKGTLSVPKKDLLAHLEVLVSTQRLKIASELKLTPILVEELRNFRAKITDSGHARFEAARSGHDDLVLALALAVWEGGRQGAAFMEVWSGMANQIDQSQPARRDAQPTPSTYIDPGGNP